VAYTAETLTTAHTGSVPSAGPTVSDARRGFGAGRAGGLGFPGAPGGSGAAPGGGSRAALAGGSGAALAGGGAMGGSAVSSALVAALKADATKYRWVAATSGSQNAASLELASGGEPVMAIGGFTGQGGNLSLAQFEQYAKAGDIHYYIASGGAAGGGFGASGLPTASVSSGSGSAAVGSAESSIASQFGTPSSSRSAASGAPGGEGFPGGSLHGGRGTRSSFPGSGRGASGATGAPGGAQSSQAITTWVEAHYKAVTIGGQTVYDLTQPKS
jgi:hypothetical protein